MHGLIEFKEPFLDFYTRGNSKTYYHLLIATKCDIPVLVHSNEYKNRLLSECRSRFKVTNAPIFCIENYSDYCRQFYGSKYRGRKFIVDDMCVFRYCHIPNEISAYQPEEVRDLVLTYLSMNAI